MDVVEVVPGTEGFGSVVDLAARVLGQDRAVVRAFPSVLESHVLGAFVDAACVGFLRYLVQVIGADVGRPPVKRDGVALTEGYVEVFGVEPDHRRHGIGDALQAHAMAHCRRLGCHQMRSRSPVTSVENYALKLGAGYVLHPSEENDSYYFLLRLRPAAPDEA